MNLYASPLRVYLTLGLFAFLGVYCGLKLPVSLYPAASHPEVEVHIELGAFSAEEFLNTYGKDLEEKLRTLQAEGVSVEKVISSYSAGDARFEVTFNWGVKSDLALRETQMLVTSYASRFPQEVRDNTHVWMQSRGSGFLAISLYSESRSLSELYELVEPVVSPKLNSVSDAASPAIWNPTQEEIRVELRPDTLATLGLQPRHVQAAISAAFSGRSAGEIAVGADILPIELPRQVRTLAALSEISVPTPSGSPVVLSDVARIHRGPKTTGTASYRTSGKPSLIIFATPKPGGNVKKMSESIIAVTQDALKTLPSDVKMSILVDPSQFIRAAVNNVFYEVFLAALLAVAVLFVFIGSPRNILTAAIEIPLSIVLAFILMRLFGINLNLISLGGLALSAGMNVDASVVVLENIFRHFEHSPGPHDASTRLRLITGAVKEVSLPLIASTIVSLVVFLPLAFTSGLSQSILGDLALAVAFSHGFSALVALILVPTIRLQLMNGGGDAPSPSYFEKPIRWLEARYSQNLRAFLTHKKAQRYTLVGLPLLLVAMALWVLPRLPRELLGTPDSDRIGISIRTEGNSLLRQMEAEIEIVEQVLAKEFAGKTVSVFAQAHGANSAFLILQGTSRKAAALLLKDLEKRFVPTPLVQYGVFPWNPSEFPLPDPPTLRVSVRGGAPEQRRLVAKGLVDTLRDGKVFPNVYSLPTPNLEYAVQLTPNSSQVEAIRNPALGYSADDLADIVRIATIGRWAGYMPGELNTTQIQLYFPQKSVSNIEEIGAIPLGVSGKTIPLRALADVKRSLNPGRISRENGRALFDVQGRLERGALSTESSIQSAKVEIAKWLKENPEQAKGVTVAYEDPSPEMTEAISQLQRAILLSLVLIFFVLVFQFGTFVEPLLVMVALPLGYIGVLAALYLFGSTLSLNSVLGVILLNGIAVANSILLVDFTKRLAPLRATATEAAVEAASVRLRPILITSLTTILGMMPLALGLGDGGKILQPLGIAVVGGMWFSVTLTLFIVPLLHTVYLNRKARASLNKQNTAWKWRLLRLKPASFVVLLACAGAQGTDLISYTQAIENIVDRHPEVAQQQAQIARVRGQTLPTRLALLPTISLYGRQDTRKELGIDASRLGGGASLDMNLFRWGSDWAGMNAANREIEAEIQTLGSTRLRVERAALEAINAWMTRTQEASIFRRVLDWRSHLFQIAKKRFQRGLIPQQEVDKLSIDLENERASLRDTETTLIQAAAELDQLLGHHRIEETWPWKDRLTSKSLLRTGKEEAILLQRPDWKAAELRLKAAQSRENQNLGRIFPSLDLNISYGLFRSGLGANDPAQVQYSTSLALTIPLFDRLSNYGAYEAQVQASRQAELELEKVRRRARSEWQSAEGSLSLAIDTALARDKTVLMARGLFDDNLKRFDKGLVDTSGLSLDQQRVLQSELLAVRGWAAAHATFAGVCFAQGLRIKECL